jgi:hypothetical protein
VIELRSAGAATAERKSSELPPSSPSSDPWRMLADDFQTQFLDRVQIARLHHARLRPEGPDLVLETPETLADTESVQVVVDENASHVRVVSEAHHARLLTWVPKDELRTVVVKRSRLNTDVIVFPGLAVEIKASTASTRQLEARAAGVSFSGSIEKQSLGVRYRPASESEPTSLEGDASIDAGTWLLATPGGAPIALFEEAADVKRSGAPDAGHQRIVFRAFASDRRDLGGFELTGFVPVARLGTAGGYGSIGGLGLRGWGGSHTVEIPAGTRFFDQPGGNLVGVAVKTVTGYRRAEQDGWIPLEIGTLWGFTTLYAER